MKIDKSNPRHWFLLFRQGLYSMAGVIARRLFPAKTRPTVIFYGHQLSGNLKALYEYWRENLTGEMDCYFLSLDPVYSQDLAAEGISALRCGRLQDMLLVARSDAIVTDHGLHAMQPLLRFTNIFFVDVWHGIPYKGFTPEAFKLQHSYNEVWVSSTLLRDLYITKFGFSPERVLPLGYSRADKLIAKLPANPSFKRKADLKPDTRLVLYAPTWKQDDSGRELFPFGENQVSFIETLADICAARSAVLVVRSHLNATIGEEQHNNVVYCPMKVFPDTESLLQETELLICDWSSISFDYLAADRPAIFLDVEPPFKDGFSLGPEYRFGRIANSMQSLCTHLANTLDNPEGYVRDQGEKHRRVAEAVYGESLDGCSSRRQWQRLQGVIGKVVPGEQD